MYLANGYSLFGSSFTHRQCEKTAESVRAGFLNWHQCHLRTPCLNLAFGCLYILGCSTGMSGAAWSRSSLLMRPHTSRWTPCGRLTGSIRRLTFFYWEREERKFFSFESYFKIISFVFFYFITFFELFDWFWVCPNSRMSLTSLFILLYFSFF